MQCRLVLRVLGREKGLAKPRRLPPDQASQSGVEQGASVCGGGDLLAGSQDGAGGGTLGYLVYLGDEGKGLFEASRSTSSRYSIVSTGIRFPPEKTCYSDGSSTKPPFPNRTGHPFALFTNPWRMRRHRMGISAQQTALSRAARRASGANGVPCHVAWALVPSCCARAGGEA